jgi:hypothetical protein
MLAIAHRTRANSRRRSAVLTRARTSGFTAAIDARTDAEYPERMTERWKHRVEAEARYSLKRNIRGVGAAR